MAANQPPPHTIDPDEERKLQLFLERAAPIVLESRVLDTENWRRLVALAKELEMTDGQLRCNRRGSASPRRDRTRRTPANQDRRPSHRRFQPVQPPSGPAPKPVRPDDVQTGGPRRRQMVFRQFAKRRFPSTRRCRLNHHLPAPCGTDFDNTNSGRAHRRLPLPRSERVRWPSQASPVNPREQLSQRAAAIIAEQRGFNPKTHSLIALVAEGSWPFGP